MNNEPIENKLNHADKIHPNVLGHRQRLADKIDAEEAAKNETKMLPPPPEAGSF